MSIIKRKSRWHIGDTGLGDARKTPLWSVKTDDEIVCFLRIFPYFLFGNMGNA
jgi:hypothetical protein